MSVSIPIQPAAEERRVGRWAFTIRSELGLVRRRLEDAWVLLPDATLGQRRVTAWGVFDGLGGMPHGAEAAAAAANHLPVVLEAATRPEGVLARLNPHVQETKGATTAVLAIASADLEEVLVLSVGDSAAYLVTLAGTLQAINEKDSDGPYVVTDYLGNANIAGHVHPLGVPPGSALFLCTDGVDGVVKETDLGTYLRAPNDAASLRALFDEIHRRGAPDNATAILARRLS